MTTKTKTKTTKHKYSFTGVIYTQHPIKLGDLHGFIEEALSCWGGQLMPPGGGDSDPTNPGDPLFGPNYAYIQSLRKGRPEKRKQ